LGGWNPARVGFVLTFGGLIGVATQTSAGAIIDAVHRKRILFAINLGVLVAGAFLLMGHLSPATVYSAQFLIGSSGAFLAPTVAAITLGIVGANSFDKQFGRNQAFNSAGNVFTALLVAYVSYRFGYRAIFVVAALLAIPAALSLFSIDPKRIDYARARGAAEENRDAKAAGLSFAAARPCPRFVFGIRFSFPLGQCSDAAATGRNAIEEQSENGGVVYVRVHYRDAIGYYVHRRVDRETSGR
jgi:MFS family permease